MGDKIVSGILVGFGGLAVLVALLVANQRIQLLTRGAIATGRIVAEARVSTGPGRRKHQTTQAPVIEYVDASTGQTVQFKSSLSTSATTVTIGRSVRVRYLPGSPEQAEIDAFWPMWTLPLGAALVGSIMLWVWWRR